MAASAPCERRVCAEFLSPAELVRPEVRALLRRAGVAPVLAARVVGDSQGAQAEADGAVARALAVYRSDAREAGRETGMGAPCLWPLLADKDGYWPSALVAEQAMARLASFRTAAAQAGAPLEPGDGVLLDLEPPLPVAVSLQGRHPLDALIRQRRAVRARFTPGTAALRTLVAALHADGLRAQAVTYPMAAAPGWEQTLGAPLSCGWDRVGLMVYTSMVAGYSHGALPLPAARRYGQLALAALARRYPGRTEAFVGVVGHGKLGDEPTHREPEALRAEVAAARAAGVTAVTAFCLEGMLAQPRPEEWLAALAAPPQARAEDRGAWRGAVAWAMTRAAGGVLSL